MELTSYFVPYEKSAIVRLSDKEIFFQMENLCCCLGPTNFTEKILHSVCKKTSSYEEIDDFKAMFEPFYLKIITFILFTLTIFFYVPFEFKLIQFEKYGGDPMKRTVINQIITQVGCNSVLSCIFFMPFLTWRIILGPLNIYLAGNPFHSFFNSINYISTEFE